MTDQIEKKGYEIFDGIQLGIGTWSWGDRLYWGYGKGYQETDLLDVFNTSIQQGIRFFDTAEVYGQGRSEKILGKYISESDQEIIVASKFMPFPWRLSRRSLIKALKKSLNRLGLSQLDLYQIHMPLPPVRIETWMEAMAEALQNNLIKAVGVSNFDLSQMQRAVESLRKMGISLASNQVEYSLINRKIEKNGVLDYCHEQGIKLIAYSPLGLGALTGKYSSSNPMQGFRGSRFSKSYLDQLKPLIDLMKKIGADHGGKSSSQVAINWAIAKGTLPIPGAKNISQAEQNTDVLNWKLTEEEVNRLDAASDALLMSEK
jgi:aryl-alcohol dehydrogenase-like predicted oxidoreductase